MNQSVITLWFRHNHINWVLADQTMVSGVNFITGLLLARYLGIEEFGRFVLAWMSVLFVNSIHHAAINSPMMSIGPKQPKEEAPAYYGAIIVQQVVFSCVAFLLLFGGIRLSGLVFPEWGTENLALPLATAAFAIQSQDFLRRYFFTQGRGAAAFANDAIRYLGQIAFLICLFMFFQETLSTVRVLWIIAGMAMVSVGYGAFFVERIEFNTNTLGTITRRHWNFSKWLTASALMQWTTGNLFIIAAGALLGTAAVGALKAAQNIMGITNILFQGLENIVPSRAASRLHQGGTQAMSEYLWRVTALGGLATAIVGIIAALAPEFWLRLFFGSEYLGHGYVLQGYAIYYVLNFLSLPLRAGIRAIEKPQAIFRAYAWMTLFSLLAFYPMTAYLGLHGVMAGVLTVNLIHLFIMWVGFQRELKKISPLEQCPDKEASKIVPREKYLEKDAPTVLKAFFDYLEKIKVKYCVMGRSEELPNKITSDIDIVIDPDSLDVFHQHIFNFCRQNNLKFVQLLQHEQSAYYYVLAWKNKDKNHIYLHPDICSNFLRNGQKFLTAKEILSERTPGRDKTGVNKGFFVAAPPKEFIYYLLKKVDKQTLNNDHGKHLSAVWAKAPDECNKEIERFWPDNCSDLLRRATREGDWEEVRQNLPTLKKSLFSKLPVSSFGTRGREFFRVLKRILHPTGLHVAFLGPDGSGKSSVINRVIPDLAPAFFRTFSFHLRPRFGGKKGGDHPVINPHGQDPRSLALSIAKIFYFWFDYLAGWLVDVRPKTVRSTLVLFDRYYHDILVDPKRYRYGGPMWLVRWVGKLIPKPDLWILLDAPGEVSQERKQEVSYEETIRQRNEYLKLVKSMKNSVVVDSSKTLDDVVADVNAIILNFMAERTEKRHA